jgi:hypothetical protein
MSEFADPLEEFDFDAMRTVCDQRLAGLLRHGGELDRLFARALDNQPDRRSRKAR